MNDEQFIEAIKQLPLASSMQNDLNDTQALKGMKTDWNTSSKQDRDLWFHSLRLMCFVDYAEDFGSIPEKYGKQAFDVSVTSVKNLKNDSRRSSSDILESIRQIGEGLKKGAVDLLVTNNYFIKSISKDASPADCYLYNIMIEVFSSEEIESLVLRYYNLFQSNEASNINETAIKSSLDTVFDKAYNSQEYQLENDQTYNGSFCQIRLKISIFLLIVLGLTVFALS